jgi:hypothetical protein
MTGLARASRWCRCGGHPKAIDHDTFTMAPQLYEAHATSVQPFAPVLALRSARFIVTLRTIWQDNRSEVQ